MTTYRPITPDNGLHSPKNFAMVKLQHLDAWQKPPESIKAVYKYFQKLPSDIMQDDPKLLDFQRGLSNEQKTSCRKIDDILGQAVAAACFSFRHHIKQESELFSNVPVFEHNDAPGEANGFRNLLESLICEIIRAIVDSRTASSNSTEMSFDLFDAPHVS